MAKVLINKTCVQRLLTIPLMNSITQAYNVFTPPTL